MLRRARGEVGGAAGGVLRIGDVTIDKHTREVTRARELGGGISVANVEGCCCFQFDLPSAIVPQAIDSREEEVVEEPSIVSRQA